MFKAYEESESFSEGRCSEFYEIIKKYLEYCFYERDNYTKLIEMKYGMIKDFIKENKNMIITAEGNSMHPNIKNGQKVNINYVVGKLEVGDIILYKSNYDLKLHRIIGKKRNNMYSVKGDAEEYIEDIHISDILGKMENNKETTSYTGSITKEAGRYRMEAQIEKNELMEIAIKWTE